MAVSIKLLGRLARKIDGSLHKTTREIGAQNVVSGRRVDSVLREFICQRK